MASGVTIEVDVVGVNLTTDSYKSTSGGVDLNLIFHLHLG